MADEYAIQVKDVTKIYKLYDKPIDRLKESLNPLHKNYHKDFYALNHISFQVKKGETVGIIGTNGSGKETALTYRQKQQKGEIWKDTCLHPSPLLRDIRIKCATRSQTRSLMNCSGRIP